MDFLVRVGEREKEAAAKGIINRRGALGIRYRVGQ